MNPHPAPGLCVVYLSETPPRGILIFSYPTPRAMLPPPPTPGAHGACEDGWISRRVENDSKDSNIF